MRGFIEERLTITGHAAGERRVRAPEFADGAARGEGALRKAAVLVPLIDRPGEMSVLLTKRTDHLRDHAGQISFPGGRMEPHDASAVETALREAEEEIGLDRAFVDIAARLDLYRTGTGFEITPIVGFVRPGFTLAIDPYEVAEVFEVPLGFVMNPDNHQRHAMSRAGKSRQYYAMPYGDYYIWGATAGMLINLYDRLYG